jgi:hypothetical protein
MHTTTHASLDSVPCVLDPETMLLTRFLFHAFVTLDIDGVCFCVLSQDRQHGSDVFQVLLTRERASNDYTSTAEQHKRGASALMRSIALVVELTALKSVCEKLGVITGTQHTRSNHAPGFHTQLSAWSSAKLLISKYAPRLKEHTTFRTRNA